MGDNAINGILSLDNLFITGWSYSRKGFLGYGNKICFEFLNNPLPMTIMDCTLVALSENGRQRFFYIIIFYFHRASSLQPGLIVYHAESFQYLPSLHN